MLAAELKLLGVIERTDFSETNQLWKPSPICTSIIIAKTEVLRLSVSQNVLIVAKCALTLIGVIEEAWTAFSKLISWGGSIAICYKVWIQLENWVLQAISIDGIVYACTTYISTPEVTSCTLCDLRSIWASVTWYSVTIFQCLFSAVYMCRDRLVQ